MDVKFGLIGLVIAATGGYVFGSGPDGELYAMPKAEVGSRLVSAPLPGEFDEALSETDRASLRTFRRGDSQIVWEFSALGVPVARMTAELSAEDAGTRVTTSFALAETRLGAAAEKDLGPLRELAEGVLKAGLAEHIDATLERRKFDQNKFTAEVAAFAIAHPDALTAAKHFHPGASDGAVETEVQEMVREERTDPRALAQGIEPEPFDPTPVDQAH